MYTRSIFYIKKNLKFKIKNLKLKIKTATSLLKDSWPLILRGIAISIYMKIDQVMIKEMMNAEAVGQYAAAVRLSEVWYFIPMVITASLFPAIINAKKKNENLYYLRLQRLYDFMAFMGIAIAVTMTFLSTWITELLYGAQYNQAGSVLVIHIWVGVFVFFAFCFVLCASCFVKSIEFSIGVKHKINKSIICNSTCDI